MFEPVLHAMVYGPPFPVPHMRPLHAAPALYRFLLTCMLGALVLHGSIYVFPISSHCFVSSLCCVLLSLAASSQLEARWDRPAEEALAALRAEIAEVRRGLFTLLELTSRRFEGYEGSGFI